MLRLSALVAMLLMSAVHGTAKHVGNVRDQICIDNLHGDYKERLARMRQQISDCTDGISTYAQSRYARDVGTGQCAARVVETCRPLVSACQRIEQEWKEATARCD